MKFISQFIVLTCLVWSGNKVLAQGTPAGYCGTGGITKWFEWYAQNRNSLADGGSDSSWLYVPMTLQITGEDNGKGHYNLELCLLSVDNMNRLFAPARIRFYLVPGDPFRYLNNSYWHDHDFDGGADLINSNRLPNRLNAFVVANPAGNCGYSWWDAIVLGGGCSGIGNTTWAHEAGHHLSLPHPFFGWEGESYNYSNAAPAEIGGHEVEKTDGSNCYNSGDYFCDTPPDYLNNRWYCNGDGESLTVQHDPNGVAFRSDASLIMGYAIDVCANRFTPEQIEAMRTNLMTQHSAYLQLDEPLQEISDDQPVQLIYPVDTVLVQYNDVTFSWNPVPNASLYTVEIAITPGLNGKYIWETVYNTTSLHLKAGIPNNKLLYWSVRPYSEWDLSKQLAPQQIGVFRTGNATATNELEKVLDAEISPNPVSAGSSARLQLNAAKSMDAHLTVQDVAGNMLSSNSLRLQSGENTLELSNQLPAGLYFVSLQNEMGSVVRRLAVGR